MKYSNDKDTLLYYGMSFLVLIIFFGGIFISGIVTGVEWGEYIPRFSWDMFNARELKQIVGLE
ncbi:MULTISPECIES: hypothetical protein [Thalassobacillus]|uniref:hypothetical protein n=1 Tax=Thalassobacillus TaxID=331971 RepID=UPI000A1CB9E4|nr:hypothetical protein [Thalassobacillus devorans]